MPERSPTSFADVHRSAVGPQRIDAPPAGLAGSPQRQTSRKCEVAQSSGHSGPRCVIATAAPGVEWHASLDAPSNGREPDEWLERRPTGDNRVDAHQG